MLRLMVTRGVGFILHGSSREKPAPHGNMRRGFSFSRDNLHKKYPAPQVIMRCGDAMKSLV
jgi:hypothetical protein